VSREIGPAYLKHPDRGVPPPRSGAPPLAVVIVMYKSHQLFELCLASVAAQLPELPVYVCQNSGDGYPGRAFQICTRRSGQPILSSTDAGQST
jgi:hypothetical protein